MSQQGRGSPLYALGSVISYAFFFLLNLVFIKVMKTFLKGYCCCGKIRVEMCQEHFLHVQNFYPISLPSLSLWSFLSPQLLICRAILDFFLFHTFSILLSSPVIVSSPPLVYKNILYTLIWVLPLSLCPSEKMGFLLLIQTSLEAPSVQATACSLQYLTPHTVPCTWEEFTLREP